MTKDISMKKLYKWAGAYIIWKYNYSGMDIKDYKSGNEELAELNRFLRYVWEHRNDE